METRSRQWSADEPECTVSFCANGQITALIIRIEVTCGVGYRLLISRAPVLLQEAQLFRVEERHPGLHHETRKSNASDVRTISNANPSEKRWLGLVPLSVVVR